jgi:hypothetical protein
VLEFQLVLRSSVFLLCPLNLKVCIRNLHIQWVPGVFPRVKVDGGEVNYFHLPSAQVNMSGAVPLLSLYDLMEWTGKSLPCFMEFGSIMLVESSGTQFRLFN